MSEFMREQRYVVVKIKDIVAAGCTPEEIAAFNVLCDRVAAYRTTAGKPPLECVVVESDWRCYKRTWNLVRDEHEQNEAAKVCAERGHDWKYLQEAGAGMYCPRCNAWRDE
jgi:hypothetical protein